MSTDQTPKRDWAGIFLALGAIAVGVFVAWWVIAGVLAIDELSVEPVDNTGECYVIDENVKNMWLTPGESYRHQGVYCKDN